MPTNQGNIGAGARWYGDELAVLRGRLASDLEDVVYPDNYCVVCVREGRDSDECFHRHWETTDQVAPAERRG